MNQHGWALITGASSGFGAAIAKRLSSSGWPVALVARREAKLTEVARQLPGPYQMFVGDVRDHDFLQTVVEALTSTKEGIEVLVNNAGLALGLEPAPQASLDDWDTMIDTNIKALVRLTRLVLPHLVSQRRGHIVNIGSIAGNWPYPGGNVYGATKAFVKQFSNNLRADLHGTGVRVTNIEPGLAETEFSIVRFKGDRSKAKQVYAGCEPLTAEDIAETVHWSVTLPPHVNINSIEIMPTCQSFGPLPVAREDKNA